MNSIDKLFPWVVFAIGLFLFDYGINGVISGMILSISAMVYFYKDNRRYEFKIICGALGIALILIIVFMIINTATSFAVNYN